MNENQIRAVVYKEGDWWIIQGLEYDFVAVAKRFEEVSEEIRRFLRVLVSASAQRGVEPFHGYSAAPRKYWKMYEKATPWEGPVQPLDLPGGLGLEARLAA
jgi:hypothetical protein